jgi:ubiquinone/menaquinone biosynthesis C-methylase UbiE
MDDPTLPAAEHQAALVQLARLNHVSRTAATLWPWIRGVASQNATVTVLDVATGSGDVPASLGLLAGRAGVSLRIHACDISPIAIDAATARMRGAGVEADAHIRDVVGKGLSQADASIDVVTCSLFLHHLADADAVRVLREMARVARRLVLVSDLRRCHSGLAAAWAATRLGTTSRVVRVDAIRSVRAAFNEQELASMASRAGMPDARILRRWPFRMLLAWEPPGPAPPMPQRSTASAGTPW